MAEHTQRTPITEPNSLSRSQHTSSSNNTHLATDDVILSLAKAHENRRARQVGEWENRQAANIRRST